MKQTPTVNEIQNQILDDIAQGFKKDIDDAIIIELLVECGWTKIEFNLTNVIQTREIFDWCISNIKLDQWKHSRDCFVFRKKKDAMMFVLRWL